jgi:hypothetical protein
VVVYSVQDDIVRVFSFLILLFVLRVIFTIVVVDIFVLFNDNVCLRCITCCLFQTSLQDNLTRDLQAHDRL